MNSDQIKTIAIANDFSRYPAGRFREDGKSSGAAFREDHLVPALRAPDVGIVKVSFDEVAGFGSSFLEEAFGGLVREEGFDKDFLDRHLELVTNEPDLKDFVELARRYITSAAERMAGNVTLHDGQAVSPLVSGLVAFASALAGAVVALYGNYRLQRYLGRRLRDAEELKTRLYDLLRLTAEYWTNDHRPRSTRQEIEARIVAEQIVVITQLMEMGNHSRSPHGLVREN